MEVNVVRGGSAGMMSNVGRVVCRNAGQCVTVGKYSRSVEQMISSKECIKMS